MRKMKKSNNDPTKLDMKSLLKQRRKDITAAMKVVEPKLKLLDSKPLKFSIEGFSDASDFWYEAEIKVGDVIILSFSIERARGKSKGWSCYIFYPHSEEHTKILKDHTSLSDAIVTCNRKWNNIVKSFQNKRKDNNSK